MQKIVSTVRVVLITFTLLSLSQAVAGNGKTFFAPQPLSSMLNFLPAGIQKSSTQERSDDTRTHRLLSALEPYAHEELDSFNRFAPLKNPQLLFAHNDNTHKHDSSSSWYASAQSSTRDTVFAPKTSLSTEKSDQKSLLTLPPHTSNSPTWTFDVTPFYIKSFNGADLRHYFFPAGKDALVIQGSLAAGTSDISGTWLKIVGTNAVAPAQALISNAFQSNFRINPTYEYLGTNLYARKHMGNFSFGQLWSEISLPVAQITVNHGMSENTLSGNVSQIESIVTYINNNHTEDPTLLYSVDAATALSQPYRQYQKFSKKPLKNIGLGDTTVRLGISKKDFKLFARLVLPTSKAPANEFMFEPQLGNGSHYGLGIGGTWDHVVQLSSLNSTFAVRAEIDGTYLLSNSQMRTFDITSFGTFSRYLIFRAADGGAGQRPWYPGVNVLTKKTTVSPTGELNAHLNGTLARGDFRCGLTYGLYVAPQERLHINDSFPAQYGAASVLGANNAAAVSFVNNPTIATPADVIPGGGLPVLPNKTISIADLDIHSATQPAKATSQFALTCGLQKKIAGDDFGINLASGLTINHTNASLKTWLIALQLTLKL